MKTIFFNAIEFEMKGPILPITFKINDNMI